VTEERIISDLLAREGGFVNHPADRGGATKFGITQDTLSAWLGRAASVEDVRALTASEAGAIYRQRFIRDLDLTASRTTACAPCSSTVPSTTAYARPCASSSGRSTSR
jgi:lysozyme family protein